MADWLKIFSGGVLQQAATRSFGMAADGSLYSLAIAILCGLGTRLFLTVHLAGLARS